MSFIAAGVAGAVAIAGTVATSAIQAGAAKKAAKTQAEAADQATQLQREMYEQQREDIAPWREAGMRALPQLEQMIAQGPGAPFRAPPGLDPRRFQFTAPTADTLRLDPGFQFRLKTGMQALEGTAAARGGLLSGGAMRGAMQLGQDLGSQEYGNAYNRAMGENQLGYGRALTQNQDQYNRALQQWQIGQGLNTAQYNRLSALAGVGQQSTEYLGQLGGQYAQQAGENILGRGNALSQGQAAVGQAWGQGIQDITGTVGNLGMFYGMNQRPPPPPAQAGYALPAQSNPWTLPFRYR
jgi:hypothetical protein